MKNLRKTFIIFLKIDYGFSKISLYSVASTNEAAFIIGGWGSAITNDRIAQFRDNTWSIFGNLQRPRSGHASITSGDKTMIIGGFIGGSG